MAKNDGVVSSLSLPRPSLHPASASRGSQRLRVFWASGVRRHETISRRLHAFAAQSTEMHGGATSRLLGKGHLQRLFSPKKQCRLHARAFSSRACIVRIGTLWRAHRAPCARTGTHARARTLLSKYIMRRRSRGEKRRRSTIMMAALINVLTLAQLRNFMSRPPVPCSESFSVCVALIRAYERETIGYWGICSDCSPPKSSVGYTLVHSLHAHALYA